MEFLKEEYDNMPKCAEKLLLDLLLKLNNDFKDEKKLDDYLNDIKKELEKENLWLDTYRDDFDLVKDFLFKQQKLKEAIMTLENLLNTRIRDLNIFTIIKLISNSKTSLGKKMDDIILLLGVTGVGKSTVLHYLAGSEMIRDETNEVKPNLDRITNPALSQVVSKFSSKSETKNVIPIKVNHFDEDEQEVFELTICDSPGFCDTNGVEVDISNSVILKNAIHSCTGIKPVLLMDLSPSNRYASLRTSAKVLFNMIIDPKLIKQSLIGMFNRVGELKPIDLKNKFQKLKEDLVNNDDESLKTLINIFCERKASEFIKLDLLDEKPEEILKILNSRSYPYIENPTRYFQVSFSSNSMYKLEKQIERHFASIQTCIRNNANNFLFKDLNYDLAKYKVDQLLKLNEWLKSDHLKRLIKSLSIRLMENTESLLKENASSLFNKIDNKEKIENKVAFNYIRAVHQSILIDPILNRFLSDEDDDEQRDNLSKFVIQLKERALNIRNFIKDSSASVYEEYKSIKSSLDMLERLMNLKTNFVDSNETLKALGNDLTDLYKQTCECLFESVKMYMNQKSDDIIKTKDVNKIVNDMENIGVFKNFDNEFIKLKTLYDELREKLKKEFESNSQESKRLLFPDNEILCVQSEDKLVSIYENLHSIDLFFNLALVNRKIDEHVSLESIQNLYTNFMQTILNFFNSIKKDFDDKIQIKDYKNLRGNFLIFYQFKKNSNFNLKLSSIYNNLLDEIVKIINAFNANSASLINKIFELKSHKDTKSNLKADTIECLKNLSDFKWFDLYKRNYVTNCFKFIEDKIEFHLNNLVFDAHDLRIDLSEFNDLKELNTTIIKIVFLDEIFHKTNFSINQTSELFSKSLHETIKEKKNVLANKVNTLLKEIQEHINEHKEKSVDYEYLEKAILFLQSCETILNLRAFDINDTRETKKSTLSFLNLRFDCLKKIINKFFQMVKLNNSFETENLSEIKKQIDPVHDSIEECIKIATKYETCAKNVGAVEYMNTCLVELNKFYICVERDFGSFFERPVENKKKILNLLELCKASSKFDKILFIQRQTNSHASLQSFDELYFQYSNDWRREANLKYDQCEQAIRCEMYIDIKNYFKHFNDNIDQTKLQTLKEKLNESLVNLVQSKIKVFVKKYLDQFTKGEDVQNSRIQNDLENVLKKFNIAKSYLHDYIYLNNNDDKLPKNEQDIKNMYQEFVNNLKDEIGTFGKNFQIEDAERKKEILEKIKFISVYLDLDDDSRKGDKENKESVDVVNVNNANVELNIKKLDDLESFNNLAYNYDFLCKERKLNHVKVAFENQIKDLFQKELNTALENSAKFKTLDTNTYFIKCKETCEKYVPVGLREKVIDSLIKTNAAKIESNLIKKNLSATYNSIVNVPHVESIDTDYYAKLLGELNEKKDYENIEIVENIILNQARKLFQYFELNLNKYKNDLMNQKELINKNFKIDFYQNIYLKFENFTELKSILKEKYASKLNVLFEQFYKQIETYVNKNGSNVIIKENFDFLNDIYESFNKKKTSLDCFNIEHLLENKLKSLFQTIIDENNTKIKSINFATNEFLNHIDFLRNAFKSSKLLIDLNVIQIFSFKESINVNDLKTFIEAKLTNLLTEMSNLRLFEEYRGKQEYDYEAFFDDYFKKLNDIHRVYSNFKEFINSFINTQYQSLLEKIKLQQMEMESNAKSYLQNILDCASKNDQILKIDQDLFNKFQNCFYNLKVFKTKSTVLIGLNFDFNFVEEQFENLILNKCETNLDSIEAKSLDECAILFCNVKEIGLKFTLFKKSVDKRLSDSIINWLKANGGFEKVGDLGLKLLTYDNGQIIINEHSEILGSYERALFYKKIPNRDIHLVLDDLLELNKESKNIKKKELLKFYQTFNSTYEDLIKEHKLKKTFDFEPIKTKILKEANENHIDNPSLIDRDKYIESMSKLTANLFALSALMINLKEINILGASSSSKPIEKESLFHPHTAQVLSIALMLNIGKTNTNTDSKNNTLDNCLIQIGTGEGKSITLSITAIILALIGYNVYCVCYSEYLSERDYESAYSLFKELNLTQNIQYGTFYDICEKVINKNVELRTVVELFIKKGEIKLDSTKSDEFKKRPNILLIDEVDVFFSENFYGNYYFPALNLQENCISNILDFIWNTYNSQDKTKLSLKFVKDSKEYKECCQVFKDWTKLIDSSIKLILNDIKTFETIDHRVDDNKIGYVDNDKISFNIEYGYKTLFAYYFYEKLSKISKSTLDKKKSLLVKLGSFSLAEIPKTDFKFILGVTGTLDTLINTKDNDTKVQKSVIENDYGIKSHVIMPSIYGTRNSVFNYKSEVYIEKEENYYNRLVSEIDNCLNKERAVFVFFENINQLNDFKQSDKFIFQFKTQVMSEVTKDDEKIRLITREAATASKLTLITKAFGRGTDFKVRDKKVNDEGVHVIQTFVSNEKSEEIQIMGRTGRQGDKGSFSMIISLKQLEKFNFFERDLNCLNRDEYYTKIDSMRNKYFENSFIDTVEKVKNIKKKHDKTTDFLNDLKSNKKQLVKEYLIDLNSNENMGLDSNKKIMILIDATGSMSKLLTKTKKSIEEMFTRVFEILRVKKVKKSFEIKITVYRNYDSPVNEILQNSEWASSADDLINFLDSIEAKGGWGEEAIEVALWQANQEEDLSEVILVGDAAANSPGQIKFKRGQYESVLKKSIYAKETETFAELEILKKKKVKVNAFYLTSEAENNFKKIAKETGGKSEFLDINLPNSSKILIDLFCEQILTSFGDKQLVDAYRTHKF